MPSSSSLPRRHWLKFTGAALAGMALAPRSPGGEALSSKPGEAPSPAMPPTVGPVRLSLNENPFGPSPAAIAAMRERAGDVCRYPGAAAARLVATLAAKEGVDPAQIVLGAGSGEVLEAFGALLGGPAGEVVAATPTYGQLTAAMQRAGSTVVEIPLDAAKVHDLEAMAAAVTATTQAVYVCNPNNPTGTLADPGRLRDFVRAVAPRAPVFVDEAYLECSDDFAANTLVGLLREGHNLTVSRTFSKIHGLAGQRIGYGVTTPAMAARIRRHVHGGTNLLALVAAQANLDDPDYVERTRRAIKAGRDGLLEVLAGLGRAYAPPQGNFVFFHTGMPAQDFRDRMLAEGVMVARPFPPFTDWARISIGSPEEMAAAHAALRAVLG